jgi:hypothetical protein
MGKATDTGSNPLGGADVVATIWLLAYLSSVGYEYERECVRDLS